MHKQITVSISRMTSNANYPKQPLIRYLIIDPSVTVQNYEATGKVIVLNKTLLAAIVPHLLVPESSGTFENFIGQHDYQNRLKYYSNVWVEKHFYFKVKNLLEEYDVNLDVDTACVLLLLVSNEYENLKRLKKLKTENKNDVDAKMHEVGELINFMQDFKKSPGRKTTIQIYKNSKLLKTLNGNIVLEEINKWYEEYYNLTRFFEWFTIKFTHRQLSKCRSAAIDYTHHISYFKHISYTSVHNWLDKNYIHSAKRIHFIRELFALKDVFNLKERTAQKGYDSIYRDLNRKVLPPE